MGFGSELTDKNRDRGLLLKDVRTEDFLKFGLIPELIGRLPITVTLEQLDEDALIEILTQPKNALVKQYKALLKLDDVELEFEDEALKYIAKVCNRKKGWSKRS